MSVIPHTGSSTPESVFSTQSRDTLPVKQPRMWFAFAQVEAQEPRHNTETWYSFSSYNISVIWFRSSNYPALFSQINSQNKNNTKPKQTITPPAPHPTTQIVEIRLIFHRLKYAESQILKDTIRNENLLMEISQMKRRLNVSWVLCYEYFYGVTTLLTFPPPRGYLNCSLYTSRNCSRHRGYKSTTCQFGLCVKPASGALLVSQSLWYLTEDMYL